MKLYAILIISLSCFFNTAFSQQHPDIGCVDKALKMQSEDIRMSFAKQGMSVYRDAMINMNSQEPFPIEVQLSKGHLYQLIFIGSKGAGKIKMEIFDGEDKKIADKDASLSSTNRNSNAIIYSFVPGKKDLYLVVLSQKLKNKNICGSFTILEQGGTNKTSPTQPGADTTIYKRPAQKK